MTYAQDTSVSVEKTRAELEKLLNQNKCEGFGYVTDHKSARIQFQIQGKFVRFNLPLPDKNDRKFSHYKRGHQTHTRTPEGTMKEWEQACRASWRALFMCVKAKLVAISVGITTFEEEFLAHIVMANGRTVGEMAIPAVRQSYLTGKMPESFLALTDGK
jgi:hypothetical protein